MVEGFFARVLVTLVYVYLYIQRTITTDILVYMVMLSGYRLQIVLAGVFEAFLSASLSIST